MAYELGALPPWQYTSKPRHWHVLWARVRTRYAASPDSHVPHLDGKVYESKREADAAWRVRQLEAQGFAYGGAVACYSKMCARKIGD